MQRSRWAHFFFEPFLLFAGDFLAIAFLTGDFFAGFFAAACEQLHAR